MKKNVILLAFIIPVLARAQKIQGIKKYTAQMEISLLGGVQNYTGFDALSPVFGVEISLQCPLVNSRKAYIRQHVKFTRQQDEKLTSTTIEINPQYIIVATPNIKVGIGPSAGLIFANIEEDHKTIFSYGLGTAAVYYVKNISIGIGGCYAMTNKVSLPGSKYGSTGAAKLNNWSTILKLGYTF